MSFCAGFYYYQGEVKNARKMQLAGGRGQPAEIRGQTSEVRVKLISDLRLLTSVIDDFNDLMN
jgi:hypothetical protein